MDSFKIGTRGSLLAVTQSTLVIEELARLTKKKFELVKIKTQGDQITDKPLWQLDGKDFFTKELDEALLKHEVDFVVHSLKDLGSIRPNHLQLGAITQRKYPHDILLIKKETAQKVASGSFKLKVGTSSPRRITNITKHLAEFLPGSQHEIHCDVLRGNVNGRIQKLKDNQYDAIILALAGLERLALFPSSAIELKKLLEGLTFIILPTLDFPPAASQGALGIEYADSHPKANEIKGILNLIHDPSTAEVVKKEREVFKNYGGGCHLAVGIHVRKIQNQFLEIHRGETQNQEVAIKKMTPPQKNPLKRDFVFLGHGKARADYILHDEFFLKESIPFELPTLQSNLVITGLHALRSLSKFHPEKKLTNFPVWTSGKKTWRHLNNQGIWVHGSHEGLGDEFLVQLLDSNAVQMMTKTNSVHFLSHPKTTIPQGNVIGCYQHEEKKINSDYLEKIKRVTHCYWSSFPQFQFYTKQCPELLNKIHYCGPGKTFTQLTQNNAHPLIALDSEDFLKEIS